MNIENHTVCSLAAAKSPTVGPRSLGRLLLVLDTLARAGGGLAFGELRTALSLPRSSLATLLQPLLKDGYLVHERGRYRLGPAMFRVASQIVSVWDPIKVVRPYLRELAERSRESVYVGVLDQADRAVVYVDSIDGPQVIRSSVPVGTIRPLYCTAAGRVLLAFADVHFQEEYLRSVKFEARTSGTITRRIALLAELNRILKGGVSVSIGEMFADSSAVSAPIYGVEGKVVAAIAIGIPTARLLPRLEEFKRLVAEIATRASGISGCGSSAGGLCRAASQQGRGLESRGFG
jgi:IclR family transcriptional regulator, acetate operon repressor